ncbi:50S ribosomal protein L18, partial [Oleiphilus sp. HI0009]
MSVKKVSRIRRAKKTRSKLKSLGETRLTIHRTPRHIYAQVIAPEGDKVLAAASTVEKDLRGEKTGNADAATKVGQLIAERAKNAGVTRV